MSDCICDKCKHSRKDTSEYPCCKCTYNSLDKFCVAKNSDLLQVDDIQKQATLIQQMICERVGYLFDDEGNVMRSEIVEWLQSEVKESEE